MTGVAGEQSIWVTHNGGTTTITLFDLYKEYVLGKLPEYQIYYADPQSIEESYEGHIVKPLTDLMPIGEVIDNGVHQKITVTSENGLQVTIGANGLLLDIHEQSPYHVTVNSPTNVRYYVSAAESLGGKPGDNLFVRMIKGFKITGASNILTLPTPNMIASSGYIVMS